MRRELLIVLFLLLITVGVASRERSMEYEHAEPGEFMERNSQSAPPFPVRAENASKFASAAGEGDSNCPPPTILIHDVTPYYSRELEAVVEVLDKYNYSSRTVLFVIPRFDPPYHGDRWDLRRNGDFVGYLHSLEKEGYRIELHGYEHTYHEFNCSYEVAMEKLKSATELMGKVGFENMSLFLPPAWALSNDSIRAIGEFNLTIVLPDYFIPPNGSKMRVWNREYTWYVGEGKAEERFLVAAHDYNATCREGIPFYLSIHPQVIVHGDGLKVLEKFLRWLKKE
ncbi:DUF2334 domain-containing protein [Palaeococcus ferrophilus]|uniref:DUF2334 domain-containing protein n=1 Tax=Palaeococcus ferrophilus TaxID=83868 RepID=UPI0006981A14|nr:DUF2334 domain-containing protein [Palaeococcus ferrophilus]